MAQATWTTCALVAVLLAAGASAYDVEESVIVGTDDNFADIIKEHEFVLAEFYAPWCGHCKQLAPEYAAAAKKLEEENSPVKLVKVDATVEEDLASEYDIQGFPTLFFFKNGKKTEYDGGRSADGIVTYVKKKSGPPATPLATVEAADAAKSATPVAVYGYFPSADSTEAKAFTEAADTIDIMFYITSDAAVAAHLSLKENGIKMLTDFDEGEYDYDGDGTDTAAIAKFVAGNSLPLVIEFTDESSQKIFGGTIDKHLLLFMKKSSDDFDKLQAEAKIVAAAYRGELLVIWVDGDVADNERVLSFFGLETSDLPTTRIINLENDKMSKYAPESTELTATALKEFAQSFLDGKLKQHLKSQEQPEDWDAKPVKVLVSKTFAKVALDPSKDVMVEFYAPWCGHCKQLAPIYDKLGEAYESHPDVVIAKMDATENELEDVEIEAFPTIKFYPKGENAEEEEYDGDRTLKKLIEYITEKTGKAGAVDDKDNGKDSKHEEL